MCCALRLLGCFEGTRAVEWCVFTFCCVKVTHSCWSEQEHLAWPRCVGSAGCVRSFAFITVLLFKQQNKPKSIAASSNHPNAQLSQKWDHNVKVSYLSFSVTWNSCHEISDLFIRLFWCFFLWSVSSVWCTEQTEHKFYLQKEKGAGWKKTWLQMILLLGEFTEMNFEPGKPQSLELND